MTDQASAAVKFDTARADDYAMHAYATRPLFPAASEEAICRFLDQAGFEEPIQFFSSPFWGAWISRRHAVARPAAPTLAS